MRTVLIGVVVVLLWGLTSSGQGQPSYTLTRGRIILHDQESQPCSFSIGQWTMLIVHPNGEPCVLIRHELEGKYIQLVAVVEEP